MKNILSIIALVILSVSCKEEVAEETVKDDGIISVTAEQFKSSGMVVASPL